MEQEIFLLQSYFGRGEYARTYEIGVFSTYEKANQAKEEIEAKIYACKQVKITNKTSEKKCEEYYKANEFNFCTIMKFTLDKLNEK